MSSTPAAKDATWSGTGTVRYLDLEGGFYGIAGDDGERYDVADLPEALRHDGLRVRYALQAVPRAMSTHMWGRIARVVEIAALR